MKNIKGWTILLAVVLLIILPAAAQTGNGGPSGSHYNLNVIGIDAEHAKTASMDDTSGHSIFIPLVGNAKIWLCDSAVCADGGYKVLDRNGMDNDGATFALPNPDVDGDGTTTYSVFARALGSPKNSPYNIVTTCATDPTGELECSVISMNLTRTKGQSKFTNVSKYLLYIYADVDEDGDVERIPLFWDGFEDFFWDWDNYGLRLTQLRFYPCSSTVPDPTDPTGPTTDTCNP